jgi:hypothetical protein
MPHIIFCSASHLRADVSKKDYTWKGKSFAKYYNHVKTKRKSKEKKQKEKVKRKQQEKAKRENNKKKRKVILLFLSLAFFAGNYNT